MNLLTSPTRPLPNHPYFRKAGESYVEQQQRIAKEREDNADACRTPRPIEHTSRCGQPDGAKCPECAAVWARVAERRR